ncbi:MAG: ATP-binding cassette domain-containing protein [Ilumatobacter sp.]|nr:ATP-binding cassette domain-containing protein [Ilumatobacter sp.]
MLDDLERLPDGLQTMLSRIFLLDREGEGTLLSGGQWQRLALARAYFADGGLLLLDEPTATLDADAEQRLACALAESSVARTSIVVSHRFSTARMADRIVVVEDGVVSEEGSHDELLARGGTYARMYNKQSAAYR